MASMVSGGTAERMAARTFFKVLRAGSGTPARYSSTVFGATLFFAAELRLPDLTFFIRAMLQEALIPRLCLSPMFTTPNFLLWANACYTIIETRCGEGPIATAGFCVLEATVLLRRIFCSPGAFPNALQRCMAA